MRARKSVQANIAFGKNRHINKTGNRQIVMQKPDQRAKGRFATDKGLGAINRINDPAIGAVLIAGAGKFLAHDHVIGETCGNGGA